MSLGPRSAWLYRALLLALASCSWQSRGCGGCDGSTKPEAVLVELRGGSLSRAHQGDANHWEKAAPGTGFAAGDDVRTDDHASASLRLPNGAQLWIGRSSVVRFLPAMVLDENNIDLMTGEAMITAGSEELHVRTHVGVATVLPGGSLRLTRAGDALQMRLEVGEARFRTGDGTTQTLSRGERVQVAVGSAVIRLTDTPTTPQDEPQFQLVVEQAGILAKSSDADSFQPLVQGAQIVANGTLLQLPAGAHSTLRREQDRVELFGQGDYVVADGKAFVSTQQGSMHVSARSRDVRIAVPGGYIVAQVVPGGGEYDLRVNAREATLTVARGEALWNANGTRTVVKPGEPLRWTIDPNSGEPTHGDAAGTAAAPDHTSFEVRAGESFVVHAGEVPVAIALHIGRACSGEAVVDLTDGARYRGTERIAFWLTTASRGYRVRCVNASGAIGRVSARGDARALEDPGTRDLPPRAPTSIVDTDGRAYTIYYQNQLPSIHVRWPNAPTAARYELKVDKQITVVPKPEYTFASGSLRDGRHELTFAAEQRSSRTASIEVRFDNTTTTASLSTPSDRGFAAGATVAIEGIALPAWKVSVDGGNIEKVNDGRFHGSVVTNANQPDFAVRLSHPQLGTHYYVRRASRSL